VTRDSDFTNTLAYPPEGFYGIVVLHLPGLMGALQPRYLCD